VAFSLFLNKRQNNSFTAFKSQQAKLAEPFPFKETKVDLVGYM